jgi:hypothetical protein
MMLGSTLCRLTSSIACLYLQIASHLIPETGYNVRGHSLAVVQRVSDAVKHERAWVDDLWKKE